MAQYKTFSTMGKDSNAPDPSTMAEVPNISNSQHRKNIIQNNLLVIIDNYTNWCGPCQECAPRFAVLAGRYSKPGVCALVKEDVDKKYGGWPVQIRGVPCFHFYMNSQFLGDETVIGADIDSVEQTIKRLLNIQ